MKTMDQNVSGKAIGRVWLKRLRIVTLMYLIILLVGSVVPTGNVVKDALTNNYFLELRWDYVLHALIYLPLGFALSVLLPVLQPVLQPVLLANSRGSGKWIWLILSGALITVSFEMVQMLLPYRSFNINDLFANGMGFIVGLVVVALLWRQYPGTAGKIV